MSDDGNKVEGGAQDDNGGAGVDLKTLQDEIESLKNMNKDLFNETKKAKSELKKFEDEKAKIEEDKLAEEGKFKELLEKEQNKNLNLAKSLKTKVMDAQLESAALKAGCTNIGAFKKLTNDYGEHVSFDDEFQADVESMTSYINKIKEDYKSLNLFEVEKKAPQDGGVGGEPKQEPKNYMTQGLEALEQMGG